MLSMVLVLLVTSTCIAGVRPIDGFEQDFQQRIARLTYYKVTNGAQLAKETESDRRELETSAVRLAKEKRLAISAGILLTPNQLEPSHVNEAQNAAPIYKLLDKALRRRPFSDADSKLLSSRGALLSDPRSMTRLRQIISERRAEIALMSRAAKLPECAFHRDWALGAELAFPEYPTIRGGVRLLRIHALVLAHDKRTDEAIDCLAMGYHIAGHVAKQPTIISHLLGIAIDAITTTALSEVLKTSPDQPKAALRIAQTITREAPAFNLVRAIQSEGVMPSIWFNHSRTAKTIKDVAEMMSVPPQDYPAGSSWMKRKLTPSEPLFAGEPLMARQLLDLSESMHLVDLRRLVVAAQKPPRIRPQLIRDEFERPPDKGVGAYYAYMFRVQSDAVIYADLGIRSKEAVAVAGAMVLAFHSKSKVWPERLEQIEANLKKRIPADPFTGTPLKYRREPNGFVIYSVGEEGKFDGGMPGKIIPGREAYFRYP
jgi:hypothetical protein